MLCNIESFDIVSPRGPRPTKLRFCCFLVVPLLPGRTPPKFFGARFIIRLAVFASEVLRIQRKSSKRAERYGTFGNGVFRAPQKNDFHKCTTLCTKHLVLLSCAIPTRRFGHFGNQLGYIAEICKSKRLERSVLRFVKSCFGDALKTRVSKMQYPRCEMLGSSCFCNTSHTVWPIMTCQALLRGPFPRQK